MKTPTSTVITTGRSPRVRRSLTGFILRGTLGRATGWVLVRVVGLGAALGG